MKLSGWRGLAWLLVSAALFVGCLAPGSAAVPRLSAAAVKATLDGWNPNYCKVAEFYGLYKAEAAGNCQVAYVSILNPSDRSQKPVIYAATFQLLFQAGGRPQWFLTGLVTHSAGIFAKRQGWDNLMIPLSEAAPASAHK